MALYHRKHGLAGKSPESVQRLFYCGLPETPQSLFKIASIIIRYARLYDLNVQTVCTQLRLPVGPYAALETTQNSQYCKSPSKKVKIEFSDFPQISKRATKQWLLFSS